MARIYLARLSWADRFAAMDRLGLRVAWKIGLGCDLGRATALLVGGNTAATLTTAANSKSNGNGNGNGKSNSMATAKINS